MKPYILFLLLFWLFSLPGVIYGAWLDQFVETKKYADDTSTYLNGLMHRMEIHKKPAVIRQGRLRRVSRDKIHSLINRASRKHGIHPAFIKAVIFAESNWNNSALSCKGAMGLMQLMPATCIDLKVTDPWNPKENIMAGTKYLRDLLLEFKDARKALAAYNFGPQRIRMNMPLPRETRIFISRVIGKYRVYRYGINSK